MHICKYTEAPFSRKRGMSSFIRNTDTVEYLAVRFFLRQCDDSVPSLSVWDPQPVCSHLTLSFNPASLPTNTSWHTLNHWARWKHSSSTHWAAAVNQLEFNSFQHFVFISTGSQGSKKQVNDLSKPGAVTSTTHCNLSNIDGLSSDLNTKWIYEELEYWIRKWGSFMDFAVSPKK